MVRLDTDAEQYLIVEIKGADWDGTADMKAQAAHRWCAALNATGRFGPSDYPLISHIPGLIPKLDTLIELVAA